MRYEFCNDCPAMCEERVHTGDSFEHCSDRFCKHSLDENGKPKKISSYCDWNEKTKPPKWCVFNPPVPPQVYAQFYVSLGYGQNIYVPVASATDDQEVIEAGREAISESFESWFPKFMEKMAKCGHSGRDCDIDFVEFVTEGENGKPYTDSIVIGEA